MKTNPFLPTKIITPPAGTTMECGGKRSATSLSTVGNRTFSLASESAVAASLCRRSPKKSHRSRPHFSAISALSSFAKVRAVRTKTSASLSSVRNGGEGRGEEALRNGGAARIGEAPLSPTLSPFVPHGARETERDSFWRFWYELSQRLPCFLLLAALFAIPSFPAVAVAAPAPATATNPPPPNILFAIADDWGYHASAYGTRWVKTPAFDRVARAGLLFTHAYTPNAKCAPSRACILTGRNSWQLKEAANHIPYFPAEFKGWGEALTEHGWFVGHTLKGWGPGVAKDANGKPRQLTGKAFNARKAAPPTSEISNNDYAGNFADFLAAAPTNAPWCFWYGAVEPHRAYEFGSGVAKGGKKLSDIDRVPGYWPDNDTVRNDLLDYAFEIEHFDRHLGRMLDTLAQRGLLENTLVVVTSDHGMPFPRVKGNAYEPANHIPFAAMWPRGIIKPGRVVDDFVSFIDLAPTFLELAGLKWAQTGMAESPGRSLTDIFRSEKSGRITPARDFVLVGKERTDIGRPNDAGYPIRGIVKDGWLYLHNFEPSRWPAGNPETGYLDCDGGATKTYVLDAHRKNAADPFWALCFGLRPREELYDLKGDPDCVRNLATDTAADTTRAALKDRMFAELQRQGDPRMSGQGDVFDKYPHANQGHVGFYERFLRGEKLRTGWVKDTDFEKLPPR